MAYSLSLAILVASLRLPVLKSNVIFFLRVSNVIIHINFQEDTDIQYS